MSRHRTALYCLFAAAILVPAGLEATDYYPTRYDDPTPGACDPADCSLREAVIAANANVNTADRIFLSAGTYLMTRSANDQTAQAGDLDILGPLEILGPGATMTTLDAGGVDRHLDIPSPNSGDWTFRLRGLTLTNAILGVSVQSVGIDVEIEDCDFTENNGTNDGQYAVSVSSANLTMSGTTLRDTAVGNGVTVHNGIGLISNSTFSTLEGTSLTVQSGATVYCNHCTVYGDEILAHEIRVHSGGVLQLANSILADVECQLVAGSILTSFGGNLESPGATCNLNQASDQDALGGVGINGLAMNGGSTPTHAITQGSFARDAANDTFCNDVDQRGGTRPASNCDSGAVEINLPTPKTPIFIDGFQQGDEEAWSDTVGN